ncbi:MAG: 3'(2'),5'-bisphosphate nucleotidase CysQ [Planctomycetota bacterium]|nr:3'(2'),5'-bisphosphate nucleotidase CysQ [Planctomycetota bacterium]
MPDELKTIVQISHSAGEEIMEVYRADDLGVDYKEDDSPLTLADRRAHKLIVAELSHQFPDIPILSEEGEAADFETRKSWGEYWIVDPLDGTKEFINRNGEFTVNIALVKDRRPVLGVVHAPAISKTSSGEADQGAFVKDGEGAVKKIAVNNNKSDRIAVRSKSHASEAEEAVLSQYGAKDCTSVGSSLKFCLVAEGKADIYYRHGPTMEWDVAAGQAVVQAAGGQVLDQQGPAPFLLTKENLLNGSFLCLGQSSN